MRLWIRNKKTNTNTNTNINRSRIASAVLSITLLSGVLFSAIANKKHKNHDDKEIIVHQQNEQKYIKRIDVLTKEAMTLKEEKSQKLSTEKHQEISLIKKKFIKYNPEINDVFIKLFITVADTYDLRESGMDYFI